MAKEKTIEIKPAKGRPMLQWVGKRPLSNQARRRTRAFPQLVVLTLALAWIASGCGQRKADQPPPPRMPPPAVAVTADLSKVTGKWLRPDGGYVLEIQSVAADGQIVAAYFNPNPIHVAAAKATQQAGTLNIFVELRDTGYPGCTYTLTYDAPTDQLRGDYFQAALQQHFDIVFIRQP